MPSKESCPILTPEKSLQEKCGIVGIFSPQTTVLQKYKDGSTSARALWHRGQGGVGIAINTESGIRRHVKKGRIIDIVLPEKPVKKIAKINGPTNWITLHDRYGTSGGHKSNNLQPIVIQTPNGINFSITHNGEFVAVDKMRKEIHERLPKDPSDTIVFSRLLKYAPGNTPDEKIFNALDKVKGAYSLLIGTDNALFAARDQFGIRPMVIGKYLDGWIIVSETHALDKLGIKTKREVKRGELVRIDKNGIITLREGQSGAGNFCDLEWAYFSRPDSLNPTHNLTDDSDHPERWLSNFMFREKCGQALAKEYPIKNADFVMGVSDSGVPAGTGYAMEMKLPYRQAILRDHYDQNGQNRVFMLDEDKENMLPMAFGKHTFPPDGRIWKDATIVIVDDSIVRGTTFNAISEILFSAGAKEVHLLSAFPQIKHQCHLGVSMRTNQELIANRNNGDEKAIARELKATSVRYISPEGFIRARIESGSIHLPKNPKEIFLANGGCGGCVTGIYPVSKDGVIFQLQD